MTCRSIPVAKPIATRLLRSSREELAHEHARGHWHSRCGRPPTDASRPAASRQIPFDPSPGDIPPSCFLLSDRTGQSVAASGIRRGTCPRHSLVLLAGFACFDPDHCLSCPTQAPGDLLHAGICVCYLLEGRFAPASNRYCVGVYSSRRSFYDCDPPASVRVWSRTSSSFPRGPHG